MAYDIQDAVTTVVSIIAAYAGYRGKQMEDRIKALEDNDSSQNAQIAAEKVKVERLESGLTELKDDVHEQIKTVSYDVKEILRHLRDSK